MKKQVILPVLALGLVVLVWVLLTWFIGFKTEQQVRRLLENNGLATASHTLLDYQRSLFSAQAITQLDVRNTPLGAWTDALRFRHMIKHGPLLWRSASGEDAAEFPAAQKSVLAALSHWQTQLDMSAVDRENRRLIKALFAEQIPLQAESVLAYDGMLGYQARLAPLRGVIDLDEAFELGNLQLAGQLDPQQKTPWAVNIRAAGVNFSNEDSQLSLPELQLTLHNTPHDIPVENSFQSGQTPDLNGSGQPAGKPERRLAVSADQVEFQIAETDETVTFTMRGTADYRKHNNVLGGTLQLTLDDFSAARYPLNQLSLHADFRGINALGLQWVNQLQHRLWDTRAQRGWYEEESEVPEARRAMQQLAVEADSITTELLQALFYRMLTPDQSRLTYTLDIASGLGDLQQTAKLSYAGTERRIQSEKLAHYSVADWLSLVRGRVQLRMDQAMLPSELRPMLNYPLQKQALLEEGGEYLMDLRLTGYDAELNGKVYPYERLAEKITPALPALLKRTGSAVPADIMSRIETQGLNDEVLQALADEQGVSAETLELLRQLKAMNEQLQQ